MDNSPPAPAPPSRVRSLGWLQMAFLAVLALWMLGRITFVTVAVWPRPVMRAVLEMASGLVLLWVGIGGTLMYVSRDRIKALCRQIPCDWRISFFLLAVLLAMSEEAITTLLTNCAPLFGVKVGEAYITASSNYFDVICCHSVITFLPAFAFWAWLLSRYDFSPFEAFVCFGIYGNIGEAIFGGFRPADSPFWMFVYGLMVYLPAYVFADRRGWRRVSWPQYLMGTAGAMACAMIWVLFLKLTMLRNHPDLHFPPIHFNEP